jgi:hypothetical protein
VAKKKKKLIIPKILLLICIISGIAVLVLRLLNRQMQVPELGVIAGYAGTAFAISVIIIIGIWVVNFVNKK